MQDLRTELEAVNCKWFSLGWSVSWDNNQEIERATWIMCCSCEKKKKHALPKEKKGVVMTSIDYCRLCEYHESKVEFVEPVEQP